MRKTFRRKRRYRRKMKGGKAVQKTKNLKIKKNKSKKKSKGKNKTKKITFKKDVCTPVKGKKEMMKYTCYTKDALKKMKALWNARHPDVKIKSNSPKKIWEQLRRNMSSSCDRESCWLNQKWLDQGMTKELNDNFATPQPETWKKNKQEWLNSLDINNVMKQYENKYNNFQFIGPSPIDFDDHEMFGECVWEELCKFNLQEKIKKQKEKIGIIFNLDPHDKPGSHWVSMFINIPKKELYYFDSYGDPTPIRIKKLAKRIQQQSTKIGKEFKFYENPVRHQYSNSECGMYCLYFIIKLIENRNYKSLINRKIKDKEMMRLRNIYFNKL
tara:strand:- start:38 stop:1018 length:981 start_codon:yes stop_codon:yes gene_type:complete